MTYFDAELRKESWIAFQVIHEWDYEIRISVPHKCLFSVGAKKTELIYAKNFQQSLAQGKH